MYNLGFTLVQFDSSILSALSIQANQKKKKRKKISKLYFFLLHSILSWWLFAVVLYAYWLVMSLQSWSFLSLIGEYQLLSFVVFYLLYQPVSCMYIYIKCFWYPFKILYTGLIQPHGFFWFFCPFIYTKLFCFVLNLPILGCIFKKKNLKKIRPV